MTYSTAIDSVVKKAIADGNRVLEISTGWTKVREVVRMESPISDETRIFFDKNNRLRAWSTEQTPHNRAEEGYTDDVDKVAISFPR